jgi:hypothetical protein
MADNSKKWKLSNKASDTGGSHWGEAKLMVIV